MAIICDHCGAPDAEPTPVDCSKTLLDSRDLCRTCKARVVEGLERVIREPAPPDESGGLTDDSVS
ncbi:MAG: hypothetical protein ACYTAN_12735 [Planctomycetota bacterium]|jgi:hypothetical protein